MTKYDRRLVARNTLSDLEGAIIALEKDGWELDATVPDQNSPTILEVLRKIRASAGGIGCSIAVPMRREIIEFTTDHAIATLSALKEQLEAGNASMSVRELKAGLNRVLDDLAKIDAASNVYLRGGETLIERISRIVDLAVAGRGT